MNFALFNLNRLNWSMLDFRLLFQINRFTFALFGLNYFLVQVILFWQI